MLSKPPERPIPMESREKAKDAPLKRLRDAARSGTADVQHSVEGALRQTDWRKYSGRKDGPDGYKFGDLSRTVVRAAKEKMRKQRGEEDDEQYLEAADESAQFGGENPVSTVVRFGGQVFGATKGLVAAQHWVQSKVVSP